MSEGLNPRFGFPRHNKENAGDFLVSRMFTDAVFNQDIRTITTIINRIDGGLPKDVDVNKYQTLFGDCINEILDMDNASRLKIMPTDTVMMAMCKSLYDIATQDIYWDHDKGRHVKPSTEVKQAHDNALRIILERAGGRKTLASVPELKEEVQLADWIAQLPGSTS